MLNGMGKVAAGVALAAVVGLLYFVIGRPIQVLPLIDPVPPAELVDQRGDAFRIHDRGGKVTIYAFGSGRDEVGVRAAAEAFAKFAERMVEEKDVALPVELVFIDLDADLDVTRSGSPERLAAVHDAFAGVRGLPVYVLTGSPMTLRLAVGSGFGVYYEPLAAGGGPPLVYEPMIIIVDWQGVMRARYPFAEGGPDILVRDVRLLDREFQAEGAERWMYAGAHLFLCYPR